MIDLSDVTFTIPIRIDSPERLENFIIILTYLLENFHTNVIILEDDTEQKISFDAPPQNVRYFFQKNDDPLFHKTRLINRLCREADTSIFAIYDADVLFAKDQYVRSVDAVRNGRCDFCLPSDSQVLDVERFFVRNILKDLSVESLSKCRSVGSAAVGGCLFCRKDAFLKGGMANEHLKSWGHEDREMLIRFTRLGFTLERITGFLYHLEHPRGLNSTKSHAHYEDNLREYEQIVSMNREELEDYIKTWEWTK